MTQGLVFYPERCKDDCQDCINACKEQFEIPLLSLSKEKIIVSCHQCEAPYCKEVCKSEAITKEKGIVRVDPELCVGCEFCLAACPYGGMYQFKPKVRKCEMCSDIEQGPLCVVACKEKALEVVNVPEETFKKIKLSANRTFTIGNDLICFVNLIESGGK